MKKHMELEPNKIKTYSAAASAALAMSLPAEADIVYSGITNLSFGLSRTATGGNTVSFEPFDIDGNGAIDFQMVSRVSFFTGFALGAAINGVVGTMGGRVLVTGGSSASNLAPGATISAGSGIFGGTGVARLASNIINGGLSTISRGLFTNSVTGIMGVQFLRNGNTHYGWLRLHIDVNFSASTPLASTRLTIIDYAWEDIADQGIAAGMTPEPSSLALLALGAAGVMASRRRKSQKSQTGKKG